MIEKLDASLFKNKNLLGLSQFQILLKQIVYWYHEMILNNIQLTNIVF